MSNAGEKVIQTATQLASKLLTAYPHFRRPPRSELGDLCAFMVTEPCETLVFLPAWAVTTFGFLVTLTPSPGSPTSGPDGTSPISSPGSTVETDKAT
jgi:hypothetical protein